MMLVITIIISWLHFKADACSGGTTSTVGQHTTGYGEDQSLDRTPIFSSSSTTDYDKSPQVISDSGYTPDLTGRPTLGGSRSMSWRSSSDDQPWPRRLPGNARIVQGLGRGSPINTAGLLATGYGEDEEPYESSFQTPLLRSFSTTEYDMPPQAMSDYTSDPTGRLAPRWSSSRSWRSSSDDEPWSRRSPGNAGTVQGLRGGDAADRLMQILQGTPPLTSGYIGQSPTTYQGSRLTGSQPVVGVVRVRSQSWPPQEPSDQSRRSMQTWSSSTSNSDGSSQPWHHRTYSYSNTDDVNDLYPADRTPIRIISTNGGDEFMNALISQISDEMARVSSSVGNPGAIRMIGVTPPISSFETEQYASPNDDTSNWWQSQIEGSQLDPSRQSQVTDRDPWGQSRENERDPRRRSQVTDSNPWGQSRENERDPRRRSQVSEDDPRRQSRVSGSDSWDRPQETERDQYRHGSGMREKDSWNSPAKVAQSDPWRSPEEVRQGYPVREWGQSSGPVSSPSQNVRTENYGTPSRAESIRDAQNMGADVRPALDSRTNGRQMSTEPSLTDDNDGSRTPEYQPPSSQSPINTQSQGFSRNQPPEGETDSKSKFIRMDSFGAEGRPPPIPGNPPHLFVPASTVNSIYHDPGDENPDKWVTPEDKLGTLPRSIILPMFQEDGMLYTEMTVGTALPGKPDQKLKVMFDTGSPHLWLLSTKSCSRQPCNANAVLFDPSKSQTYKPDGTAEHSVYGSGQISGEFAEDTVTIGEGRNKLVLRKQKIGEAHSFVGAFDGFDMLCGMNLASPPMMKKNKDSLLYTMTKQYGTTLPFGFYTNRYNSQGSKMIFGEGYQQFIEGDLHTNEVQKFPIKGLGLFYKGWYVKFDGWMIQAPKARPIQIPMKTSMLAIIDSGSSVIVGPVEAMREINQYIFQFATFQVNPDFTFPCEVKPTQIFLELPDVSFFIGGVKYTLAPYDYISKIEGECKAKFIGMASIDFIILGSPFWTKYFIRFDHSKKTVQFALSKQEHDRDLAQGHKMMETRRWG